MNNSYTSYKSYVESTDYYKDLNTAIKLSNEMIVNIDNLINALNRNNGGPIANAIADLDKMKNDINRAFIQHYTKLKKQIIANANSYDAKYSSLKGTVGNITSRTSSESLRDGKVVNVIVEKKVKSVDIDSSTGYIRLIKSVYGNVTDPDGKNIVNVSPSTITELYNSSGLVS